MAHSLDPDRRAEVDYDRLVRGLTASQVRLPEGVSAERVGRNPVWRVEMHGPGSSVRYVKVANERGWFERELRGFRAAARLAEEHEWAVAAEILHVDPDRRAIVTSALPGSDVGSLLRGALRLDRNPLRRRRPRERLTAALEAVVRWLSHFHLEACEEGGELYDLYDHTPSAVRARIEEKLKRAVDQGLLAVDPATLESLRQLDLAAGEGRIRLLCGDATLGNFFWDGERIGRVDFEDLGYGHPARDFFELSHCLDRASANRWYWSADSFSSLVPRPSDSMETKLYLLEWKVDLHWRSALDGRERQSGRLARDVSETLEALSS